MIQAQEIELKRLSPNRGQIEGVPANPRKVAKDQIKDLMRSIEETPEMLELREVIVYDNIDELVIIGGERRYEALKALKRKTAYTKVLPNDTPKEVLNAIIIKDNTHTGEWDIDLLMSEWDKSVLSDWGVDLNWGGGENSVSQPKEKEDLSNEIDITYKLEITCVSEREQEQLYNEFIEKGYECRLLTL